MQNIQSEVKILAAAVYEIRLLLSNYLGSQNTAERNVVEAAHLAYALHNEALAVLENRSFDQLAAFSKIKAVDKIFGGNVASRMDEHLGA